MELKVTVHPNSKKPRIDEDLFGQLHIYVSQPPLEGRANRAVMDVLGEHLKVSKSKIKLLRGQKSKLKTFLIDN